MTIMTIDKRLADAEAKNRKEIPKKIAEELVNVQPMNVNFLDVMKALEGTTFGHNIGVCMSNGGRGKRKDYAK